MFSVEVDGLLSISADDYTEARFAKFGGDQLRDERFVLGQEDGFVAGGMPSVRSGCRGGGHVREGQVDGNRRSFFRSALHLECAANLAGIAVEKG